MLALLDYDNYLIQKLLNLTKQNNFYSLLIDYIYDRLLYLHLSKVDAYLIY